MFEPWWEAVEIPAFGFWISDWAAVGIGLRAPFLNLGHRGRERTMSQEIFKLMHLQGLTPGDTPNVDRHHGKGIGLYSSEERALEGLRRVAGLPGFRDWPDGFRVFTDEVGRIFWRAGFWPGPDGTDLAIAGDPSGRDGTDQGLAEWGQDATRDIAEWDAYLARWDNPDDPEQLWELYHYKIAETNDQGFEDMGMKFLGFFASRVEAEAARRDLADRPGFRDWQGGFRFHMAGLDTDHWLSGFVTEDD